MNRDFENPTGNDAQIHAMQAAYGDLRRLRLFEGIPNDALWRLITQNQVHIIALERDHLLDSSVAANLGASIFFVLRGQLAVGVFDSEVLAKRRALQDTQNRLSEAERKEQSLLTPPPLAREAKKNVAIFSEHDLLNSQVFSQEVAADVAAYTVAPSTIMAIGHGAISEWVMQFPFFEQRLRRAVEISRDRLRNIAGVKQEILDFFVRHGISVSGEMVRVRQLDSCIDCKLCEIACEERYGAKRLTLGGYQLGMLDFIFTCRTCTDQRCIDPCEYDSIRYDEKLKEVVINEASCVGCTLCAQQCPYSAIEMVDIEDPSNPSFREPFKMRLQADGSLGFGPGKPRVARARRIANKCDHCMGYKEQACVSACPTGSLIEISAYDLFRERVGAASKIASDGYNRDVAITHKEILPPEPFTRGIGVRDAGMAKVRRGRLGPVLLWGLGLTAFFLALAEILLRIYQPTSSLQYMLLRKDGMEPVIAELKVGYRAGTDLAINCGYVGAGLMLLAILYTPLRRLKIFRKLASNTMWFDLHMMAGTVGPMFIVLHSALKLDNWVSAAFWSMVIVVVSGVMGRYLYTQVPDLLNGRELEELDHERALAELRQTVPSVVTRADGLLAAYRKRAELVAERGSMLFALGWLVGQDLLRPYRWFARRMALQGPGMSSKMRSDLAYRTGRLMLVERRRVLVPQAKLLLHSWKKIHVPFSLVMAIIAIVHIVVAFMYSM